MHPLSNRSLIIEPASPEQRPHVYRRHCKARRDWQCKQRQSALLAGGRRICEPLIEPSPNNRRTLKWRILIRPFTIAELIQFDDGAFACLLCLFRLWLCINCNAKLSLNGFVISCPFFRPARQPHCQSYIVTRTESREFKCIQFKSRVQGSERKRKTKPL